MLNRVFFLLKCVCAICIQVSSASLHSVVYVSPKRGVGGLTENPSRPQECLSNPVHQVPSASASRLTVFFHWHLSYAPGTGRAGLMHTRQGLHPTLVRIASVDKVGQPGWYMDMDLKFYSCEDIQLRDPNPEISCNNFDIKILWSLTLAITD